MTTFRTQNFQAEGVLTFWDNGRETDPELMSKGLIALGLPRYCPNTRSWPRSLKTAISELTKDRLIRSLASRNNNGYTVIEEIRGDDENEFVRDFNARVDADTGMVELVHYEGEDKDAFLAELQEKTHYFKRVLPADSVSKVMVKIIKEELNGVAIRENGGLYYVPQNNAQRWRQIGTAIEHAGVGNHVTCTAMEVNESTLLSIKSSVERDIVSECDKIAAEIASNEFTDRGINNRVQRANALVDRIESYERILDSTLKVCRESVVRAMDALTVETAVADTLATFAGLYQ